MWLDNQNIEILYHSGKTKMCFLKVTGNCRWHETVDFTALKSEQIFCRQCKTCGYCIYYSTGKDFTFL